VPLTAAENQLLTQYLAAKNAQTLSAAQAASNSMGVASAAQMKGYTPPRMIGLGSPTTMNPALLNPAGQVGAPPIILGPKKPGIIRIGIAQSKVDFGQGFQGPSAGESVRTLLSQYLTGPKFESVSLTALLPQQIDSEAKDRQCDYVVYSSATMKKGGGFGLLKAASSVASMMPMGAALGAAGAIAGSAASSAALGLSGQIKAKSEVTVEYHVFVPGSSTAVLENKTSAKAKSDGEDVVTPQIEAAATSIVGKLSAK
jgi:hypothetical protein